MIFRKITKNDELYPNKLKQIIDPPQVLYYLGDIMLLQNNCLAIVGCRNASQYGIKIAKIFANEISKAGITIVSGLARGIDTTAHKYALSSIGKTIAVLGCGIDIIYPRENEGLFKDIINNGGLIISEFEPGTAPLKENFPKRNRIISALSEGILVVEAKKRSGTMITVDCALEQGKDVFVIPGNIDSLNSVGTNELIKEGAICVTNYNEVIGTFAKSHI